jgi:hypothetical protein
VLFKTKDDMDKFLKADVKYEDAELIKMLKWVKFWLRIEGVFGRIRNEMWRFNVWVDIRPRINPFAPTGFWGSPVPRGPTLRRK